MFDESLERLQLLLSRNRRSVYTPLGISLEYREAPDHGSQGSEDFRW